MSDLIVETHNKLAQAEKYFGETKYWQTVRTAASLCEKSQFEEAGNILDFLPSKSELLKSLMVKLKNKSVYTTLKKIVAGTIVDGPVFVKGLGSLLAHVAIEVEHGNTEYRLLYPVIYEKLGEILYRD